MVRLFVFSLRYDEKIQINQLELPSDEQCSLTTDLELSAPCILLILFKVLGRETHCEA
jgi:hypothetical protein